LSESRWWKHLVQESFTPSNASLSMIIEHAHDLVGQHAFFLTTYWIW
jgi:hypothetical protein